MILSLKRAVPLLFPFNAFFYFILRLILRQIGGFVNEESASLHFVDLPNGNAPVLQMETDEACFSFTVKTLQESIGFVFQGNIYKSGILRMQIPYP